jgi:hypothetical protein
LRTYSESSLHCSSAYKSARADVGTMMMTSTTAAAGGAHDCAATRLLEVVGPPGMAV